MCVCVRVCGGEGGGGGPTGPEPPVAVCAATQQDAGRLPRAADTAFEVELGGLRQRIEHGESQFHANVSVLVNIRGKSKRMLMHGEDIFYTEKEKEGSEIIAF